jgi:SecD/SecF fusion protein
MISSGKRGNGGWILPATIGVLLLGLSATIAHAQSDSGSATTPAVSAATADAKIGSSQEATPAATGDAKSFDAAKDAQAPVSAATTDATSDSKTSNAATATTGEGTTGSQVPTSTFDTAMLGILIIAILVLPVLAGNYLAKLVRMPDYGWKISLVLFAIAAGSVIVGRGQFKFGPDLAGGITLVYEVEEPSTPAEQNNAAANQPAGASGVAPNKAQMDKLIGALRKRIDPTSTKEITIRPQGSWAVEVIIPKTGPDALESVKRRITALGELEFRITADPLWAPDRPKIEQAKLA